jgi:AraC-like DNA-binding protein
LNETDLTASSYREWPVPVAAERARCWWEQRVGAAGRVQRVIPDGCSDIIVVAGGAAIVVGPTMQTDLVSLPAGAHVRGLRLRTSALAAVLGCPGTEIRDRSEPLAALLPARLARCVADAVWARRRIEALDLEGPVEARLRFAVGRLSGDAKVNIAGLADEVGLTGRHLRRLMREHTGLGPGELVRVGRLHRFLTLADRSLVPTGMASLAIQAGYADQPHLNRDVRELTQLTPRALLRERQAGTGVDRSALR